MPLPDEVQQHIRSTIAAKDDQLVREMNRERRDVACELAATGLSNSSVRVQRDIEAIESFIEKRMTAHAEIYLNTLAELGIRIDSDLEAEIVQHLEGLKTAQNKAMPPGMAMTNVPLMREIYRSRLGSADTLALSNAKNRLRMARLKDTLPVPESQPPIMSHTHNYTATGPNARVNVGSTDNSSNTIQIGASPPPSETTKKQGWTVSDRLAVALCCISGLMTVVPMWMEKTPIWAAGTVCAMALLVVYPVHHFIRPWTRKIPVLIVVWAAIVVFGWKIWPRQVTALPQPVVRGEPAQPEANIQLKQPAFQPKALATTQSPIDNKLPPFVQIKVFNNATARVVNVGKVPISDVQIDISTHTVDKEYPTPGKTDDLTPQVTRSNYWSSAFQVRSKELRPGEHDQFDLTKMAHWNELPYSQETANAASPEKLDEIFRTFFVFRFTFRHAGTGEKYACFRVHGSYLKFPSQVDDNTSQSGSPSMLGFSNSLRDVLIENAKQRYRDGAKEILCDN
jgi:hypothetical protein